MATIIQIKRSANVSAPTTSDLVEGELAYSQDKSNSGVGAKLYIESLDSGGSPVIHAIGGKYYTDVVDGATSSATASTLVKRDATGNFNGNVITANTFVGTFSGSSESANIASFANVLTTPRTISLVGDVTGSVSFNGSQDVSIVTTANVNSVALGTDTTGDYVSNVLAGTGISVTGQGGETATPTVALATSGVAAGSYGGATQIPAIVVDTYGRITSVSNSAISTTITVLGDTGTDDLSTGQAIQFDGGSGIGTAVAADGANTVVTISIASSGVVANTYGGTTAIPVFTVDATGRITSASNTAISTSFTAAGDSGTNQTVNGGDTLTIAGGAGIATTAGATDTITIDLETSGVSAGTYGDAAKQAVFSVDTYGRITSASNVTTQIALGTNTTGAYVANLVAGTGISLSGLGDEGTTPTITNSGVTSAASGGFGLTVSAATGAVTFTNTGVTRVTSGGHGLTVDANTGNVEITNNGVTAVIGTANEIEVSGATGNVTIGLPTDVTVTRDLTVGGNLYVTGNVVSLPVENLVVEDSLIQLANNNTSSDVIDIGFYGSYNQGGGDHEHAGLFRDASDGIFKLFQGLHGQGNLTSTVNISGDGYTLATLNADLLASNANVYTALTFGGNQHKITPTTASVLEIIGGLGDANGALSLAAGNYPTAYSKIYLESAKKITMQAEELYVTLFNDGNTKVLTMNTTHTAAVSTSTGALRVSGGVGITGNIYANYFNGSIDCGTY